MKRLSDVLIVTVLCALILGTLWIVADAEAQPQFVKGCGVYAEQLTLVILEDKYPSLLQDSWLNWKADNPYALMHDVEYAIQVVPNQHSHYSIAVWYCTERE